MTQCPGGNCPLQDGCQHKDAYNNPGVNDEGGFELPPYNSDKANCDYFFSNGTFINPQADQQ